MARTSVSVRPAQASDLGALCALGVELRDQVLDVPSRGRSNGRAGLEARYLEAIADPDRHVVLAVGADGEPLGMALFTVGSGNALLDLPAVHVSHAVVSDRHKRRGAGRALVAAAAAFAEERGLDQLVVSVHPGSRDANRFFARLGFAPLAVRRVAPVSVVRRNLAVGALGESVVRRRPGRLPRPRSAAQAPTEAQPLA